MSMGGRTGTIFTEINITPLTDVFLVLLVVMMLLAPYFSRFVLKVKVPGPNAGAHAQTIEPCIDVYVQANGNMLVNKHLLAEGSDSIYNALGSALKELKVPADKTEVVLEAEPDALQKYVVAVIDAATVMQLKVRVVSLKVRRAATD